MLTTGLVFAGLFSLGGFFNCCDSKIKKGSDVVALLIGLTIAAAAVVTVVHQIVAIN